MKLRICVIGAGAAGLCAGRHMIYSPEKYDFIIFEQTSDVGGTWNYTEKVGLDEHNIPIHSSMYKNLRTNVPKEIMGYPDFPFSNAGKSFTHHSQVLIYLKNYANEHGLRSKIKFNSRVKTVTPEEIPGKRRIWKVLVTNLETGVDSDFEFDGIMVCNGHFAVPNIPLIENIENFNGVKIHSHSYRKPEIFRDKTVLVLGAGSSGMDIAIEISQYAKQVYLSHNKSKHKCKLPENIKQTPGIKLAKEDGFYLLNDLYVKADVLLYCTGYRYNFPFLTEKCKVTVAGNRVTPLYKHLIHMDFPELCFIGLPFTVLPFPFFHYQVLFYLRSLDGEIVKLPARKIMEEDTEKDYQKRIVDMKMPPKYAHKMGHLQWEYIEDLGNTADIGNLPPVYRMVYNTVEEERINNVMFYKREDYRVLGEEEFVRMMPD